MTVENQSSIRFSVEESIWFQKGQEVSELLSMSLDPEIIIQEHDQYISVRGGLVLTGEYHAGGMDDEERLSTLPTGFRTVQDVTTREDGVSVLKHKFPVDITIPKNRIQNLNDVYVTIEMFDYELPQRGNLLLEADLSISGIYEDQEHERPAANDLNNTNEEYVEEEPETEEVIVPYNQEEVVEEELVQPLMRGSFYEEETEEAEAEQENDPFTPFVVEAKRHTTDEFEEVELVQEEPYVFTRQAPQFELKSRIDHAQTTYKKAVHEEEKYGNRDENTLSLTKIFAKDDEFETTRLKMCIVQKNESIEMIASKYGVQSQALIRVNHLDREHLAEGQIIYIPVLTGSRK
ncbi:stage VI sporulation protein D [Bacillus sp. DJP31]|uniref:stage VI sporulation protein D n=1 Tax=Bacillus sp. DJP31 TaxID=3409789 RepID=UPI003BB50369